MQIVGYDTGTPATDTEDGREAALLLAEAGAVRRVSLVPGADVAFSLGARRCAGAVDGDDHYPCENEASPYCEVHASTWVCARCTGTCLKDEMDCYEDHAVYLAAFAPATFKVGVTRSWRLETRLYEQGADRAAHLHTVSDGRIARELEADIATDVGDSVRVPTKIAGLGAAVDVDAWTDLLTTYDPIDTYAFDYGLGLDHRPVSETLARGRVRGTKGRVLVLDTAGSTYAVDMRSLVGHDVDEDGDEEGSERALQSSLGAFG